MTTQQDAEMARPRQAAPADGPPGPGGGPAGAAPAGAQRSLAGAFGASFWVALALTVASLVPTLMLPGRPAGGGAA